MPEARVPTDAQFDAYADRVLESLPGAGEAIRVLLDALGPGRCRVALRDGDVVAGLTVVPMEQHVGGTLVRSAGISCVVTAPTHRHLGIASRLLAETLNELRADGVPLSCLHPANLPLYRIAGYEVAATQRRCRVPVERFEVERPGLTTTVRELPDPGPGELEPLHAAWVARVAGAVSRSAPLWEGLLRWAPAPVHVALSERAGEPNGYAAYLPGQDGVLQVRDVVALDGDGARAVLTHLAAQAEGHAAVEWPSAGFDPFAHLLRDRHAEIRTQPVMLRLVDVRAALAARGYPRGVSGRLDFEVADRVVGGNAGRVRLEVDGGAARATRGGEGRIRLHVRALVALWTGYATVAGLRVAGELRAHAADLALLEAAFAGPQPVVNESF